MKNDIVKYESDSDVLTIKVDEHPGPDNIIVSEPVEHVVTLVLNSVTGGLVEFEIMGLLSNCLNDMIPEIRQQMMYDVECDSLLLHFGKEDQQGMCDLIYKEEVGGLLITANRNEVGNLVGIELCGITQCLTGE